jgi:hypothetical protein
MSRIDESNALQALDDEAAGIYGSVRETLIAARRKTVTAINSAMVDAYWEIGQHIAESQQESKGSGNQRGSVSFYFFLPFSHVILSYVQNINDTDPFVTLKGRGTGLSFV